MRDSLERLNDELGSKYRLERELGAGGMATVYLATDLRHQRSVAVKVLRAELAASIGAERFLREIRITAGLSHPRILPLIDSGEVAGSLYYVMPFVEGESLRARIDRDKQLPIPEAISIALAVADALAFAHRHGIVHRDIKPENVLLGENGPLVADFGIARALEPTAARVTETGLALGTPGYMSPEQALGDGTVTPRSDVYSLGCLLYEMLVGEPPYTGPTPQAIFARAMSGAIPVASRTRETVSEAIDGVIARALAKAPADRFADAGEFGEALGRAEAMPDGKRRGRGRGRVLAGVGVAAVVVGVIAAVVLFSRNSSQAPKPTVPALVVLPFENLGAPDDAGFADGVTDEITARLAGVAGLTVKARQSAMAYRGTRKTPQEIGRELGVDYVLEATVSWERRADGQRRVRVRPQLIRSRDANHVWATTFDEDLTEVFVVQEKIAKQVVEALAPALVAQAGDAREGRSDPQSYYATALTRPIPTDPDLRTGTLDNGLRYYIRANAEPRRRATFRLEIAGGSLVEGEGEHGYTHLIEHMMFEGIPLFNGRFVDYLHSIGVRYGADLNGMSYFDNSAAFMQVPTDRAVVVDSAVRILRSWAAEIRYDSAAVERARRAAMEEWRAIHAGTGEASSQILPALMAGVSPTPHNPIGDTITIQRTRPAALARFANAWHRPDLMAVIAVGDFNPDSVEHLIRRDFSDLKRGGAQRPRPLTVADDKETRIRVVVADRVTPRVSIVYLQPADTQLTVGAYREAVVRSLLVALLSDRLSERALDSKPPFLSANAGRSPLAGGLLTLMLSSSIADSGHARALEVLVVEGERVARHGFTDREITRAKGAMLRRMQREYDERGKRQSDSYVTEYADAFREGSALPGTAFEYGLFKRFLPTIGAADIQALARKWLVDRNRTVLAVMRSSPATRTAEADLRATLETARLAEIGPYQERRDTVALPAARRAAGKVVTTETLPDVGVTIWSLANGARVLVKPTDFKVDDIQFQSYRRGGTSLADDADYRSAYLAGVIATRSGFGTVSALDLRRTLSDKIVEITPYLSDPREGFTGRTSPKDLETFLQVLALHFTEPRTDSAAFQAYIAQWRATIASRATNPQVLVLDTLAAATANGARRLMPLSEASLAEVDQRKALSFYRSRFGDAGGFTFVFTGSVDLTVLRPLVEKYIGGLPSSARVARERDRGMRPPDGIIKKVVHVGGASQAQVAISFSGPMDFSDSTRQTVRTIVDVMQNRLVATLRDSMGGAYNTYARGTYDNVPWSFYRIDVGFATSAERVDELTAASFRLLEDLVTRGPTEEELARVRSGQRRQRETDVRDNAFWVSNLAAWTRGWMHPRLLANMEFVDGQTPAMVRDAARRYLTLDRYVMVRVVP